jgi:UDP-glucose 4-epimerase
MKVLITGGAGFIGSHLCDSFVARGEDVAILDNLSTGSKNNIAHLEGKIKVSQGDIRDQNLVESLVEDCDVIVHMAAALGVNNILENPIEAISTNFFGSEVILNSAVKYDKRIIIASTSEIYGKNPKQPLTEQDDRVVGTPQKLRWTYSDAKALEEAIAYSLFLTKNLKVITVRLFNTVGLCQTGKYGMVLPRFVDAALADKPIYVYGDGTQSRVFCHVYDAVNALQTLAYSQDCFGEVFNIGGNEVISILELAQKVAKMSKSKSEIMFVNYQDAYGPEYEDVQNRIPDINKIKTRINWKPIKTLENMIQDVIESIVRGI